MKKSIDDIAREHGTETIITSFTPDSLEEYFRTTTRFGLGWDSGWIWASIATEGGQKYAFTRGYQKASTDLFMSTKFLEDTSAVSPRLYKRLYMGPSSFDKVPDKEMIQVKSYPSKHHFEIDIEVNQFRWQEERGDVDLHLEAMGPACRFMIPGAKIKEDLYYTSELCRVTGTVHGESVSGFGGLDQAWLPHGISWPQSKAYLYFEEYWIVWANRYADGSTDYGIAGYGPGDWTLSYYVRDGRPDMSRDNDYKMTYAEEGYPSEAEFRMGSHQFKWICECRLNEIKGHVLWANGQMINRHEKEPPVQGFSWIEYRPHGKFNETT